MIKILISNICRSYQIVFSIKEKKLDKQSGQRRKTGDWWVICDIVIGYDGRMIIAPIEMMIKYQSSKYYLQE